jgi:CDP-glycerol glycerophosphotransferase (TagB/SpsB family)
MGVKNSMADLKFSVVMALYNSQNYLDDAIQSVVSQDIGFKDNVELIIVDDGSSDDSIEIANKYKELYPQNVVILSKENGGPASARNFGLMHANGEFVNFLDSDDKLSSNALTTVYNFFSKHENIDLAAIPMIFFDRENGNHYLNYKFASEKIVDLRNEINYPQLSVSSSFIRRNIIKSEFNEDLIDGEDIVFINDILIDKQRYGLISNAKYFYRKRFDSSEYMHNLFSDKKAYTDKINFVYKHLIESSLAKDERVADFIQYLILLDLKGMLTSTEFCDVFDDAWEIEEFWNSLYHVLGYIDKNVILNHDFLNGDIKSFLIYLKNKDFHVVTKGKKVFFKSDDHVISRLHDVKLQLDIVELKGNVLNVSGFFKSVCSKEFISFEAVKVDNDGLKEKFHPEYVDYFDRRNDVFFGVDWNFRSSFDFKIPVDEKGLSRIYFNILYSEDNHNVKMGTRFSFGKFLTLSPFSSYFVKDSKIVYLYDDSIFIDDYSFMKMCKHEFRDLSKIVKSNKSKVSNALFFRLMHLFSYPLMKNKRIWLFEDRLTVADDNAEHLFKYSINQKDGIRKYFVIDKDCSDFKRMSEIDRNVVAFGSMKHKLLYLFSEKIISSHVDHSVLNPFNDYDLSLYNGLFTIQRCFLQHGITLHDVSYWIRKDYVNLFLFVTSNDMERQSILEGEYNFDDDVVQSFGFCRYDNLNNGNIKKQILFMPTWRNYIRGRDLFMNSSHFLRINSFINNERLLVYLKENDFQLVFKPHFEIYEHIDLFNIPDGVKVSSNESYQELFNESAILITDFSSVAFDFAYLKKPILYYQAEMDYHNERSYFDYDDMGFGEVIRSEDELVDVVIEYMENDSKMKDRYLNRVKSFFKFTDNNNCKRCYEWLRENR